MVLLVRQLRRTSARFINRRIDTRYIGQKNTKNTKMARLSLFVKKKKKELPRYKSRYNDAPVVRPIDIYTVTNLLSLSSSFISFFSSLSLSLSLPLPPSLFTCDFHQI